MRGLAIEVKGDWLPSDQFENEVIALLVDKEYPQADVIDALRTCPWKDVVWVIRDSDKAAFYACTEAGIEPTPIPLNHWYKSDQYDGRRNMRECDMLYGCTHILVFRNANSQASAHWEDRPSARAKIHIVTHGKPKRKAKSGNPRGSTEVRD